MESRQPKISSDKIQKIIITCFIGTTILIKTLNMTIFLYRHYLGPPHPADNLVSAPVTGFSPFNVGFLQRLRRSKSPMYESVKSAFSTSAPTRLVPVNTAFWNIAPRNEDLHKP